MGLYVPIETGFLPVYFSSGGTTSIYRLKIGFYTHIVRRMQLGDGITM